MSLGGRCPVTAVHRIVAAGAARATGERLRPADGGPAPMDISPIVVTVVLTALVDFTNGFHDTANAMAISIATGALRPRVAVGIAAVPDLAGAFLSVRPRGRSPGVWSVTGKIVLPALVADVRVVPEPGPVGLTVR